MAIALETATPPGERESAKATVDLCDDAIKSEHGFSDIGVNVALTVGSSGHYVGN